MVLNVKKVLVCWLGGTDLRAMREPDQVGLGPIGEAVKNRKYDMVVLLNNYPVKETNGYSEWLRTLSKAEIFLHHQDLSSPTNFGEIYEAAVKIVTEQIRKHGKEKIQK